MLEDTIAAIATPPGEGGIGIIRLSGAAALAIADSIFRSQSGVKLADLPSYRFRYGRVINSEGLAIDEALALVMRAPRSYSGEHVVEIHCHGGTVVLRETLALALSQGARLAHPGEFTKRAFLNGRLDLSQAEAVLDIIQAPTSLGLKVALDQLEGSLSRRIGGLREKLYELVVQVEASLDFPEDDLPEIEVDAAASLLDFCLDDLERLLATADDGRILRQGLKTVICGRPNVGKSTLLNTLLDENRALVTDIPGTTRDSIEELINLRGAPLRLIDTAGIRESANVVEQLGVARSYQLLAQADLVLHVLDRSVALEPADFELLERTASLPRLVLVNKTDLPALWDSAELGDLKGAPVLELSLAGDRVKAVDALAEQILSLVGSGHIQSSAGSGALLTRLRHEQSLKEAQVALLAAKRTLNEGFPWDLVAVDLYNALERLGEITGETVRENVLDRIFAQFCVGK